MASVPFAEKAKDTITEALVGTEESANVSSESKDRFLKYASLEENGERFMSLEDFVDAIAPPDEDYVSCLFLPAQPNIHTDPVPSTKSNESNMAFSSVSQMCPDEAN